jgi:hypothetical protein
MDPLCGDGPPPCWLHLLRGMALAGDGYPLASADSSSLARNHKGSPAPGAPPRDPGKRAGETAARQCPASWRRSPKQIQLLASFG